MVSSWGDERATRRSTVRLYCTGLRTVDTITGTENQVALTQGEDRAELAELRPCERLDAAVCERHTIPDLRLYLLTAKIGLTIKRSLKCKRAFRTVPVALRLSMKRCVRKIQYTPWVSERRGSNETTMPIVGQVLCGKEEDPEDSHRSEDGAAESFWSRPLYFFGIVSSIMPIQLAAVIFRFQVDERQETQGQGEDTGRSVAYDMTMLTKSSPCLP